MSSKDEKEAYEFEKNIKAVRTVSEGESEEDKEESINPAAF